MGTRQKLNQSYFVGSLLIAALIGKMAESWLVFLVALVVLVGCNLYCNEIRPVRRNNSSPGRSCR